MIWLAALLPSVVLLVALHDARVRVREADAATRALLAQQAEAHAVERGEWTRERQALLNRIKPETAQPVFEPGPVRTPPAVGFDNDDEYWESVQEMSKDDLAVAMMRQELAERRGVAA